MSTRSALPPARDVAQEIWRIATTLSEDMQVAAVHKARELQFDTDKGRIPLQETLINLTHNPQWSWQGDEKRKQQD